MSADAGSRLDRAKIWSRTQRVASGRLAQWMRGGAVSRQCLVSSCRAQTPILQTHAPTALLTSQKTFIMPSKAISGLFRSSETLVCESVCDSGPLYRCRRLCELLLTVDRLLPWHPLNLRS